MTLDEAGNVYLLCQVVAADPHLEAASLQKFDNNGQFLMEYTDPTSYNPTDLACVSSGQLYIVAQNGTLA